MFPCSIRFEKFCNAFSGPTIQPVKLVIVNSSDMSNPKTILLLIFIHIAPYAVPAPLATYYLKLFTMVYRLFLFPQLEYIFIASDVSSGRNGTMTSKIISFFLASIPLTYILLLSPHIATSNILLPLLVSNT